MLSFSCGLKVCCRQVWDKNALLLSNIKFILLIYIKNSIYNASIIRNETITFEGVIYKMIN